MKLDLILENIRSRYSLGLLEESAGMSERDLLKGKLMINESTMAIRSMLVEEGTIAAVKSNLEEAWSAALIQEFEGMEGVSDAVKDALTPTSHVGQGAMAGLNIGADGVAHQGAPASLADMAQHKAGVAGNQIAKTYDTAAQAVKTVGQDALAGVKQAGTDAKTYLTGGPHNAFNGTGLTSTTPSGEVVHADSGLNQDIAAAKAAANNGIAAVKQAGQQGVTSVGQAVDAAGQYANANKGLVGAGAGIAGLASYGALNAGRNLAGAVRQRVR